MSGAPYSSLIAQCEDKAYMLEEELFFFLPLIYGIPTVFLYIHIIAVIIVKRKNSMLKATFFKIYAVYSVMMVIMWCFDMISTRFIGIGYFCRELLDKWGPPSYALSPVQFVMTYSRHAQFYAATVLSINRMTAVVFPTSYTYIWERQWRTFLMLMLVLPLFTSWYLLPTRSKLVPYTLGGLTIQYAKILPNALCSVTFTTVFVASICALIILCATFATYVRLASYKGNANHWSNVDKNLLIVGMISSISTLLSAIAEVPLYLVINYKIKSHTLFFIAICIKQIVIDLTFLFSAWSITFFCSTLRCSIFRVNFTSKCLMRRKMMVVDNGTNISTTKVKTSDKDKRPPITVCIEEHTPRAPSTLSEQHHNHGTGRAPEYSII